MGTDIYGGIEIRDPVAEYAPDERGPQAWVSPNLSPGVYVPWAKAMDLSPLYADFDYASFGLLFGIRNRAGYEPIAADRGLPTDVSSGLRDDLQPGLEAGHLEGATWVTWAELAAIDPLTMPKEYVGRLIYERASAPHLWTRQLVTTQWPAELIESVGPPPVGFDPLAPLPEWTTGEVRCRYQVLTAQSVLTDEDSHWRHVFAVMKALAGRFGDDSVRLVAAFD